MSDNKSSEYGKHTPFDLFAAELTDAAYRVVLRHGVEDAWIELEIALWRSLADTVERWRQQLPEHDDVDHGPRRQPGSGRRLTG